MASESFDFKPGKLKANLRQFDGSINAYVAALFDFRRDKAIAYMKTNAPWTDRTGNARQTLNAHAEHSLVEHVLKLYGGMPYQIFLEVRWGGRYGIIGKAVKYQGLALMNQIRGLMTRLGRL